MNKYIKLTYNLYTVSDDGKQDLVERTTAEHPYHFITGLGMAHDAFEAHVSPLESDEEFNFVLPVDEAYGPYEEAHILDLDKAMFSIDGHFDATHIYPGAVIPLINEDGNRFQGLVMEIGGETVKVDLNHPLAGKTLQFKGRILESREATNKEIEGMLNMLSGEGCDCEDCQGGHQHGEGCSCGHHH